MRVDRSGAVTIWQPPSLKVTGGGFGIDAKTETRRARA